MVRDATTDASLSPNPLFSRQFMLLAMASTLAVGATGYGFWRFQVSQSSAAESVVTAPQIKTVTALGRLEPSGEVIKLSAPTSAEGNRVDHLLVKEGDAVKAGQVIAVLDSHDRLTAALEEAQERVRVAQMNLAKVQAGAKTGEIQAQQAAIARLEAERSGDQAAQSATVDRLVAELRNAQTEDQRHQDLYQQGAISASLRDSKRLAVDTAGERLQEAQANLARIRTAKLQQVNEARANLDRIAEVRPVDVAAAQAEVSSAQAALKRAKANLDQAFVRAPQAGQILKIHTRPGELVSNEGIAEIGQTRKMYAIAEVYESDVAKVRVGQLAQVTSDALPGELQGTVEYVGLQVKKQNVINTDPSANVDARIVEVKVRLNDDSSQQAAPFTNLQVKVVMAQ